jgi:hypothetical protein
VPKPFTLSPEQRAEFEARGVLRLPGFYDPATIAPMADALWADLEARLGLVRGRPETWTIVRPAQFQGLTHGATFDALGSPALHALADDLLGAGAWDVPRRWGQPLVTFPSARSDPPGPVWHFDLPGDDYRVGLPGLRLFGFLEPVAPGGGGTLVVAGAHRLALEIARNGGPIPSATMRKKLKAAHPWFARMVEAPMDAVPDYVGVPAEVGGVQVVVEEMTGSPGDLVVMHPLMLHGVAHNGSDRARMMVVSTIWRKARSG